MNIDLNRGVLMRKHRATGVKIFMYLDQPGVYLNVFGAEVPEEFAKIAGFDVESYAKARWKREKMAEFKDKIEAELAMAEEGAEATVLAERDGFKVIDAKLGNVIVIDPDGNRLTERPISEVEGMLLLDHLVPTKGKKAPKE